jgi:hypothetical protein
MFVFTELAGNEIKQFFPDFFDENGRFFEILKQEKCIGFIGIRSIDQKSVELEVYINLDYRRYITKQFAFLVMDFPKQLGFEKTYMLPEHNSVRHFFDFLEKSGKINTEMMNQTTYFVRA